MNRTKLAAILTLLLLASSIARVASAANGNPSAGPSEPASPIRKEARPWSAKMQELYKTLSDLLTDVTSDKRFYDPANRHRITSEAGKLAALAHDLGAKGMVSLDTDPTVRIVAEMLGRETRRAVTELKRNNLGQARNILRSVPSYCITCHSRNASGPQFVELPLHAGGASMSPMERGEFFAASRQFERAQTEFKSIIKDPKVAKPFSLELEKAVRYALAIAVRVKQDPAEAEEIVDSLLAKSAQTPTSLKEDAREWKNSIREWKEERPHAAVSEEGLYAEALRLMSKARDLQKYPMDRTADVLYLRASAAVHDLLQASPKGPHLGDALLLAGLSYEILSPLRMEDLHDVYYEACVRAAPHTPTSELCYRRYEQSAFVTYGGSAVYDVPADVVKRLIELRPLAEQASGQMPR